MDTRREFVKKAALLSGAAGLWSTLPPSLQQALAIEPEPGSTFLDAEHVVILMQENRSFDHCFGTLRGVRGFDDPRAITLPDGNPVWLQTNAAGETYAPFRLNLKETKATWMGSLPHSWTNQVDARNGGRCDRWLDAKPSGHAEYARMPLTLGYYDRQDIPFYYALADAFTICDQNFCSSLTGTTPNRLYLWTGTIRPTPDPAAPAAVRNEDVDYGREASWTTFPERLEEMGVSWKIYQNELSLDSGFVGEEDAWLSNFTDNPIEWFTQYQVRFAPGHRRFLEKKAATLKAELAQLEARQAQQATSLATGEAIAAKRTEWKQAEDELARWSPENFAKLPERQRNLHRKAFCDNSGDPKYRSLSKLSYHDSGTERTVQVPAGDILHQFRQDVQRGELPTVSWLVAPENFSDHPGAPWYGAWYVSEVLEILTRNPEVWKKTILLLTYDENDGYFDHVPPFVPPHPGKPESGKVSAGIDTAIEYVPLDQDLKRKPAREARESPIGLGYRVPLIVASPWSRGGRVNSEVFDHTSPLQFLEVFLSHKTGKKVAEPNISAWRRTICGDLTSVFQPQPGASTAAPAPLARDAVVQQIHQARFKNPPSDFRPLTGDETQRIRLATTPDPLLPRQEKGVRPACALPYELYADGAIDPARGGIALRFEARSRAFGKRAAGAPFQVYVRDGPETIQVRSYAVRAGDALTDTIPVNRFNNLPYRVEVHGPNGFLRALSGTAGDPKVESALEYESARGALTGNVVVRLTNRDRTAHRITIRDAAYGAAEQVRELRPGASARVPVNNRRSFGWYDILVSIEGKPSFEKRYAGRVETGKDSFTDPLIGGAA